MIRILTKPGPAISQILVVIGALLISFSPVFVVVSGVSPVSSAFYRMAFSLPALLVLLLVMKGTYTLTVRSLIIACLCSLAYTLDLVSWHTSIHLIGPGLATILGNFQVFVLALYSILILHTKATLRLILSIPLAIIGLYFICGRIWEGASDGYQLGVILALSTALWYGSYVLFLRSIQLDSDLKGKITNLCLISVFTTLFVGIVGLGTGEEFIIPDTGSLMYLIMYGIICQVIAWLLISTALPQVDPIRVGLILLLQPAGAFIWDIFIFNLPVTWITLAGVVITLGAIYLGSTSGPGPDQEKKIKET